MATRAAGIIRWLSAHRRLFIALMLTLAGLPMIRWYVLSIPPPISTVFPSGELVVGIDASYPPFASVGSDGQLMGIDVEVARALGEKLGLSVRFVNMGYDGLYDSLRAGQVDVLISALLIDPQRTADVYYSWAYYNAGLILVSPGATRFDSMRDIAGHRLAYAYGSSADAEARAWSRRIAAFERRPYETARYALDAVRLGQADAALVDATSGRQYLSAHPDWQAEYAYVTTALYSAASDRKREGVWRWVNTAMLEMLNDGTLDAILARGLSD